MHTRTHTLDDKQIEKVVAKLGHGSNLAPFCPAHFSTSSPCTLSLSLGKLSASTVAAVVDLAAQTKRKETLKRLLTYVHTNTLTRTHTDTLYT